MGGRRQWCVPCGGMGGAWGACVGWGGVGVWSWRRRRRPGWAKAERHPALYGAAAIYMPYAPSPLGAGRERAIQWHCGSTGVHTTARCGSSTS